VINTQERISLLHEGGNPITVYSEEDATILVETFSKKFKSKAKGYTIKKKGNKWIVDYVPPEED
jgi:hypothetical protein